MTRAWLALIASLAGAAALLACTSECTGSTPCVSSPPAPLAVAAAAPPATAAAAAAGPEAALGLPPLPHAVDQAPAKVALGRKLFFDRRLSFNGTMSCAMCHVPEEGFASRASRLGIGIEGKSLRRNAPTVLNVAWQTALFWDGRENNLVTQAWSPLLHADEMANPSVGHVMSTIAGLPDYANLFEAAFDGRPASMDTVGQALASYEATLVAADSAFDRWYFAGQADALNAAEQRGFALFTGKARCAQCHAVQREGTLLSDGRFHVTGAGANAALPERVQIELIPGVRAEISRRELASITEPGTTDLGRFELSLLEADRRAFRTPSLRNVALTAPYMHDGSLAQLADVIRFYDRGGGDVEGKTPLLQTLHLSDTEQDDLVAFLHSLSSPHAATLAAAARQP